MTVWRRAASTYLSLFVISAVVFGGFRAGESGSITHGVVSGLIYGAFLSAILGTVVVVGQRGNTGSWSPRRRATVVVPEGEAMARRQAHIALDELNARVTVDEPTHLSARTGFSAKTWGTRIDIAFRTERGHTTVDLRIRPRVPFTVIDYGAAHRTLETLTHHLTPRRVGGPAA